MWGASIAAGATAPAIHAGVVVYTKGKEVSKREINDIQNVEIRE
jgi:hypothetical protein